jgi:TRAP-type C4-dicarboxylate transport system permease small subunit
MPLDSVILFFLIIVYGSVKIFEEKHYADVHSLLDLAYAHIYLSIY